MAEDPFVYGGKSEILCEVAKPLIRCVAAAKASSARAVLAFRDGRQEQGGPGSGERLSGRGHTVEK